MECFNHHGVAAVAICKNCGRGVCEDCASDVGNGIACRGACEARVIEANEVSEISKRIARRSEAIISRSRTTYAGQAMMMVAIGLVPLMLGLLSLGRNQVFSTVLIAFGAVFLFYAAFLFRTSRAILKS